MRPINNLHLVGLTGRDGAGRRTAATVLAERHHCLVLATSRAICQEIGAAWGVDPRLLEDPHTRGTALPELALERCTDASFLTFANHFLRNRSYSRARSPLELMRWWGADYRRHQDADYWLRILADSIVAAMRRGHYRIAVQDIRYPNEAAFVRELGGRIWRIRQARAEAETPAHISEAFIRWLSVHAEIRNDGSLDEFERAVTYQWLDTFEATEAHHGIR